MKFHGIDLLIIGKFLFPTDTWKTAVLPTRNDRTLLQRPLQGLEQVDGEEISMEKYQLQSY